MAQVEVRIFRKRREIARVERPLRHLDGKPKPVDETRFWPLINGGEVYLDDIAPADDAHTADATGTDETDATPEFQVAPPALVEWDRSQRDVIDAPPEDRLLVGAGPGTGKTAVACARVSQLIDGTGLEPSRVWLISFTRATVREIRDRITAYLGRCGGRLPDHRGLATLV